MLGIGRGHRGVLDVRAWAWRRVDRAMAWAAGASGVAARIAGIRVVLSRGCAVALAVLLTVLMLPLALACWLCGG